jgi:hypothetical protein
MASLEVEIRRATVPGQSGQKDGRLPSQQKSWAWCCMPVIPTMQKIGNRRTVVQAHPSINTRPYSKKNLKQTGHQQLMPVILVIWEVEMQRVMF